MAVLEGGGGGGGRKRREDGGGGGGVFVSRGNEMPSRFLIGEI